MKKPQNKKITVMIDEDFQAEMQSIKEEFNVNWSEKIKRFVALEMKIIKEGKNDDFKEWMRQQFLHIQ